MTKLNPTGSALVYSTYLGFGGWGIALDTLPNPNAYVTGAGLTDFLTTPGAFQTTFGGFGDAFVAKVAELTFAGTPGTPNCFGTSVSALAQQFGGLDAAAAALGFPSVQALQDAIRVFCEA